jgi:hypothetical protein
MITCLKTQYNHKSENIFEWRAYYVVDSSLHRYHFDRKCFVCFQKQNALTESFNIDKYTKEQLIDIEEKIQAKMLIDEIGDVVYDNDGIALRGMGSTT